MHLTQARRTLPVRGQVSKMAENSQQMTTDPSVLHLLQKIVEVSARQERTSREQGAGLIQCGGKLTQHGSMLENHEKSINENGASLKLIIKKIDGHYSSHVKSLDRMEAAMEIQFNTANVITQALIGESEERQKEYNQKLLELKTQRLQRQIDALRAKMAKRDVAIKKQQNPKAGVLGIGTAKKVTLGFKRQAIQKIQAIMDRDHVEANEAILKVAKLRKFAELGRGNLARWWGDGDKIVQFLYRNPEKAAAYYMLG